LPFAEGEVSPKFPISASGQAFQRHYRDATFSCDVAQDVLGVLSEVQTGYYLACDLACAPQAAFPARHPNSAKAGICSRPKAAATMHSSRRPADYRIQKMRAAEESSRQMNAYVKVRTCL